MQKMIFLCLAVFLIAGCTREIGPDSLPIHSDDSIRQAMVRQLEETGSHFMLSTQSANLRKEDRIFFAVSNNDTAERTFNIRIRECKSIGDTCSLVALESSPFTVPPRQSVGSDFVLINKGSTGDTLILTIEASDDLSSFTRDLEIST